MLFCHLLVLRICVGDQPQLLLQEKLGHCKTECFVDMFVILRLATILNHVDS